MTTAPAADDDLIAPDNVIQIETAAAEAREAALAADAAREWRGEILQPWSEERARLLDALCAADIPMPPLHEVDEATFINGYFPRAVKALFLAAHDPELLIRQRPRLLRLIDQWGIEHVPAFDFADKVAAVNLVLDMEGAHRKLMTLHRRTAGATAHARHAGN